MKTFLIAIGCLFVIFVVLPAIIAFVAKFFQEEYPSDQAFICNPGRHYVLYKDGKRSQYMPYREANDYAAIFGGKVYSEPKPRERTT